MSPSYFVLNKEGCAYAAQKNKLTKYLQKRIVMTQMKQQAK